MRKQFKKTMAALLSAAMVLTLGSGTDLKLASADDAGTGAAADGYQAYIGYQVGETYDYRNGFDNDPVDVNFYEMGRDKPNKDGQGGPVDGVQESNDVTQAFIKKDQDTYVLRYDNLNLKTPKTYTRDETKDQYYNQLFVSTGIPVSMKDSVEVQVKSLKIDDVEVAADFKAPARHDAANYLDFMIVNAYGKEEHGYKYYSSDAVDKNPNSAKALNKLPESSLEIEFQITGIDWTVDPQLIEVNAAPKPTPTVPPASKETAQPAQKISTPFDIYLGANVNDALAPERTVTINGKEEKQASSYYGTAAIKEKLLADGTVTEDGKEAYGEDGTSVKPYFITEETGSYHITETGEYKMTVTAQGDCENMVASGAVWLPTTLSDMPKDFKLTGKEIVVTGADGTVKGTYVWSKAMLYKDNTGSVRMSVANQWGTGDKMDPNSDFGKANPLYGQTIPVAKGDKITFDFFVSAGAVVEKPKPTMTAPPASSKYNAYLGFQTDNYAFRNVQDDPDYGLKSTKLNYKTDIGYWGVDNPNAAKPKEALLKYKPTIKDVEMTKNQQYTVSMTGLNLQTLKGNAKDAFVSKKFLMLFVSTDIPTTMKNVAIKNAMLKIDGKQVGSVMASVPNKGDAEKYYQFMISNTYAPNDGTKNCPYPAGKLLSVLPKQSIEITFTLSGVDFDKKTVGPAKGKSFSSGNFKYKVTKASTKSGTKVTAGKVTVTGLTSKGKKAKKLTLKDTVSKSGGKFTITTLTKNSFKGAKKVKTITLNKKITKLPANVFAKANCKKLTTVSFKTALKSVNKNAFKGLKKIKVKGKKAAANKKKIKKACKKLKVK